MSDTFTVLVCGGRDYADKAKVFHVLDEIKKQADARNKEMQVVHGGARGADYLAQLWVEKRKVGGKCFPADWDTHKKAAGPIRNQQMIDEGKPDAVVAFAGGRGTADMIRRAEANNIKVVEIK